MWSFGIAEGYGIGPNAEKSGAAGGCEFFRGKLRAMRPPRPQPIKAAAVVLDPGWSAQDAVRQIVRACLAHFATNAAQIARSRNPEFLHQARVALRRMRSALRLLPPGDQQADSLRAGLRWLSAELGAARDWDVLLADTLPPVAREYARAPQGAASAGAGSARLLAAARRKRARARRRAREALESGRCAGLLQTLGDWLAGPGLPTLHIDGLAQFAAREIGKRHKRLLRDARDFASLGAEDRHAIRIDAKRLRYAVEFFGSLFETEASRRYLRQLMQAQDALGTLNDAFVALRLLDPLLAAQPGAGGFASFARGWLAATEADSLAAASSTLKRLAGTERFWKAPA